MLTTTILFRVPAISGTYSGEWKKKSTGVGDFSFNLAGTNKVPSDSFSRRPGGSCFRSRRCERVCSTIGDGFWGKPVCSGAACTGSCRPEQRKQQEKVTRQSRYARFGFIIVSSGLCWKQIYVSVPCQKLEIAYEVKLHRPIFQLR